MSDFKAKMHQIQRSPDPLAGFKGPTSRGRRKGTEGKKGGEYGRGGVDPQGFAEMTCHAPDC